MKKKIWRKSGKQAGKGRAIKVKRIEDLEQINYHAAGIDIGSESHFVCVPPGASESPVKEFGSFTRDLYAIADWLSECGVKTVAMESTGVYWIPLYEVLEERGFEVKLVDAGKVKNVSGRKTDVLDCQWLQQLESYGLLKGAFRPEEEIAVLRSYTRQREMLVKSAATHIQHMQKALQQMNLRLETVVSDITGETGMKIIKAILKGERDVKKLGALRNSRCHSSESEIAESLVGNYRKEHLFSLRQAVELFEFYQNKIRECESEMERHLKTMTHKRDDEPPSDKSRKTNSLSFNVRDEVWKLTGVDLFRVHGMGSETILRVIGEVGLNVGSRFPNEKCFCRWLGLSPENKISGGRVLISKTKPCKNRAAAAFRQAATSLERSPSELGAFYRRMKARLGPPKAITATAHKIARIFYHLMKTGEQYIDKGANAYEEKQRERMLKNLSKRAQGYGYKLVAIAQQTNHNQIGDLVVS